MHIVALVESSRHVCCRYRVAAFRSHWEAAGHTVDIRDLGPSLFTRWEAIRSVRDADLVILQRKLLAPLETRLLRKFARKLVFDFDDAIWLRDSYSRHGFVSTKRLGRFAAVASRADVVVAGNEFLADNARKLSKSVIVIPTCVEPEDYPQAEYWRDEASVNMVWIGSSSTLRGLERESSLFETIGQSLPGARMKVICDRFPKFANLPVDEIPWSQTSERREIASSDIGVGLVPDDPWSQGKCGLKLLQYQAAGVACVANPVGVQADIVRHGVTGLQARTAREWDAAVRTLAYNPSLRRDLGLAGRAQVEREYSVRTGAMKWLEVFESLG